MASGADTPNTFTNLRPVLDFVMHADITTASVAIDGCTNPLTHSSTNLDDCVASFPVRFSVESDAEEDTVKACDNNTITVSVPDTIVWENVATDPTLSSPTYSWVVTPSGDAAEDAVATEDLAYAVSSTTA